MERRSYIRGIGIVCAQGTGTAEVWQSLLGGAVLRDHAPAPLPRISDTRVTELAMESAREAVKRAEWSASVLADPRTALVIGTSKGPIERWLREMQPHAKPRPMIGVGEVAADVAAALGMGYGPRLTLAAACALGLQALVRADMLIRAGDCDRALVIGAESSLHPIFVSSFARLGVLARPEVGCRPFDIAREGFLLSEASAAVCLDRAGGAILIDRGAMAADAYHLTGADPSGDALRYLLEAVTGDTRIDLVHAHGTGTVSNDPVELAAIERTIGRYAPAIYSHKAALGHTQGAAGMLGVVLNCLMHRNGVALPNPNTVNPIATNGVTISRNAQQRAIQRSVVLAAGFGGALAALSLQSE